MDFLEKLDTLMKIKGINRNVLAKESGIPYTTIAGFYAKGYSNVKLSTIQKLCNYFGVTLDYLLRDDITEIEYSVPKTDSLSVSGIEKEIILAYRHADEIGKAIILRSLGLENPPS